MTSVVLDLLGGDHAPEAVVDGALLVADRSPDIRVTLVGPIALATGLLEARGAAGRLAVVGADDVVGNHESPTRGVRSKPHATVRVCADMVRDGAADAMVSVGSTGAALTAARLSLGRLRGVSRPALAGVVPAQRGPLVLLDIGATPDVDATLLAQFALAGVAFAQVRLGIAEPRVGLLTIGEEAGKGDTLRKEAHDLLHRLPIHFVGNVEGSDVPLGGAADVIVTDGFTGNVLLKGLEGLARVLGGAGSSRLAPEVLGGAVLLGVNGVCVIGHGSSGPEAVASCVEVAGQAVSEGLVPKVGRALGRLLDEQQVVPT